MFSTVDLLDLARERQGGVSDYRLAKLLGVSSSQLSNYRCKRNTPANPVAMRLGELCGLDPLQVVAWVNLERLNAESEREVWRTLLARLEAQPRPALAA